MSRGDLKDLGEQLDKGQAGLVVVGVSDMGAKIEAAMTKADKVEEKQLDADTADLAKDVEAAG
jgi:GTP-binding protein EngB required for normal cell division